MQANSKIDHKVMIYDFTPSKTNFKSNFFEEK